jgi:hypothetical protein
VSSNNHTVYYREDGKSALVEFWHGMTDYNTVGRITFVPGHPGSMFCFEKVHGESDFAVPATELLGILNKLTGNEQFPARATDETQVLPRIVDDGSSSYAR